MPIETIAIIGVTAVIAGALLFVVSHVVRFAIRLVLIAALTYFLLWKLKPELVPGPDHLWQSVKTSRARV